MNIQALQRGRNNGNANSGGDEGKRRNHVRRFLSDPGAEASCVTGGNDNIAALVIECQGGYVRARPADSVPPGEARGDRLSEPELLILGIEDLDGAEAERTGNLVRQLGELFGRQGS